MSNFIKIKKIKFEVELVYRYGCAIYVSVCKNKKNSKFLNQKFYKLSKKIIIMFENQCFKQKFDVFPIFVYEKKYFRDF